MSIKQSPSDSSIVRETGTEQHTKHTRRALARQHSDSEATPNIEAPGQVVCSDVGMMFDEDGSILHRETGAASISLDEFSTEELSWGLLSFDKEIYNKWVHAVDENVFPEKSARTLVINAWNVQLDEEGMTVADAMNAGHLPGTVRQYVITQYQQQADDKMGAEMPSAAATKAQILPDEVDKKTVSCPECDAGSLHKEGRQMGAADEGQTVFIRCDCCDYMQKGGYGG